MNVRFFNRVFLKLVRVLNILFNALFGFFEKMGWTKPIFFVELWNKRDVMEVVHTYPVNFDVADKHLFNEWHRYNTFENKIFELQNVFVSDKGVVFMNFQCFVPALPHPVFKADYGFLFSLKKYFFSKKISISATEKYLLVFDHWAYANYFHWMVDSMCRLIVWKEQLQEYTILLPARPPKFMLGTLDLLGINKRMVIQKGTFLEIPLLHIPNYSAWSGQQHPIVLREVKKFILSRVKVQEGPKKIYISRARQKNRRLSNEAQVITTLKSFGFEIVYFEGMSLAEQLNLVKNADFIVTSHGANLTNALFSEARIFELLREDKPNFCYWSTLDCVGLSYYYQLCPVVNHDDLLVDIERFKLNLQKMLNE